MQRPRRNLAKPSSSSAPHCVRITLNGSPFKGADSTCGVLGTPAGTPSPFSSPTSLPHPVESNQAASKTFPGEKANRPSICSSEPGAPSGDLGTKPRCAAVRPAHRWSIRTACRRTVSLRPAGPRRPLPLDPALGLRGVKLRIIGVT